MLLQWAAAAAFVAVAADAVPAQEFGNVQRGASLANSLCAECHGVTAGQPSRNTAAPTFVGIAETPGMTGLALEAALQTAHRQMPNVMLDSAERADIIAYIRSLRKAN